MVKRKPKRRPQHRPIYYKKKFAEHPDQKAALDLISEAARQPKRLISDEEYTELYWQAQALIQKGE